ncbi:MAG: DUF4397 domain-containing protein [Nitrosarchaeum sp.]|nr:DUF4397 domain-containing protein [Nitrosarchaeum sp.]
MVVPVVAVVMIVMMAGSALAYGAQPIRGFSDAKVRVLHASPDAPSVDVLVDGAPAFQDVEFREFTDYAKLRFGSYNVQVVPAGETAPVVIDADLQLRPVRFYTVIALDNLAEIEPLVLQDRNFFVREGQSRVRFVHASPDAPAVDIAVAGGPVLFSDVEFKEFATRSVPAGTYDLEVRLAGTDTVVLSLPGIALEERTAYTAVAVGEVGQGTLGAVLQKDAQWPYRVKN